MKKFTKTAFDLEEILATASELKYTAAIKRIISDEFDNMRSCDQDRFEEMAVTMKGRKRPYLSYESSELRQPHQVPKTYLFVEVNLSSIMIARLCEDLIVKMGYSAGELDFEVR